MFVENVATSVAALQWWLSSSELEHAGLVSTSGSELPCALHMLGSTRVSRSRSNARSKAVASCASEMEPEALAGRGGDFRKRGVGMVSTRRNYMDPFSLLSP